MNLVLKTYMFNFIDKNPINVDNIIMDIILYILLGVFILIILIGLAIVNYATENMVSIFNRYTNIISEYSPPEFIEMVSNNLFHGRIINKRVKGYFVDCLKGNTIEISDEFYEKKNLPVLTISAHELGHALQYKNTPEKMKKFIKRVKLSKILSKFTIPLFIASIACLFFNNIASIILISLTFLILLISFWVKALTIGIEKEASKNAIALLQTYANFNQDEIKISKKILNSAKLTYIADFLKSILKWTFLTRK